MATHQTATLTVSQQLTAHIAPTDADGNPTDPNRVVWSCSDESIASVVQSEGSGDAHIIGNSPGKCQVAVNVNAKPEPGAAPKSGRSKPVLGVLSVTVTAGEVTDVTITCDPPVEQGSDPSLPSRPVRPGNALPKPPGTIDNTLPGGRPDRPDAGLPNAPVRPDAGLPPGASPKR